MTRVADQRSAVRAQPWMLQRLLGLGLFVARCALVRNLLQTSVCIDLSYDPLSHSRHNAGDSSTKVGHEIMYTTKACDAWRVRRQTYGSLPSITASPLFDRYQVTLIGDRGI